MVLYLTIITVNVVFFQIYKIGVENKHSFFASRFALRTLMCRLTEMKHNTIHFLHFTQKLTSRNTRLMPISRD